MVQTRNKLMFNKYLLVFLVTTVCHITAHNIHIERKIDQPEDQSRIETIYAQMKQMRKGKYECYKLYDEKNALQALHDAHAFRNNILHAVIGTATIACISFGSYILKHFHKHMYDSPPAGNSLEKAIQESVASENPFHKALNNIFKEQFNKVGLLNTKILLTIECIVIGIITDYVFKYKDVQRLKDAISEKTHALTEKTRQTNALLNNLQQLVATSSEFNDTDKDKLMSILINHKQDIL